VLRPSRDSVEAIIWWEKRRIVYNLLLFIAGAVTILVIELVGARFANPGEDVEEPLGIIIGGIAYVLGANECYTMGWVTEIIWSGGDTSNTKGRRAAIFRWATAFSVLLTIAPAVFVPLVWWVFGFQH